MLSCLTALRTLETKYDLTESEKRMMAQARALGGAVPPWHGVRACVRACARR